MFRQDAGNLSASFHSLITPRAVVLEKRRCCFDDAAGVTVHSSTAEICRSLQGARMAAYVYACHFDFVHPLNWVVTRFVDTA